MWSRIIMPMCFPPCQWQGNSFWQLQMLLGGLRVTFCCLSLISEGVTILPSKVEHIKKCQTLMECVGILEHFERFFVQVAYVVHVGICCGKILCAGLLTWSWLSPQLLPWPTFTGKYEPKNHWNYAIDLVKLQRPHTSFHPKWWFSKGNPLISGKSRLVKYYNLPRLIPPWNLLPTSEICGTYGCFQK